MSKLVRHPMSFHKSLDEIRHDFENGDTPQAIIDVFDRHIEDLMSRNLAERIPSVGSTIAIGDRTVVSEAGKQKIASFVGQRFLVATWFRGNW